MLELVIHRLGPTGGNVGINGMMPSDGPAPANTVVKVNNAYSYIRFSTGKQLKGSSEERQQAMLDNWAEANPTFTLIRDLTFKSMRCSLSPPYLLGLAHLRASYH